MDWFHQNLKLTRLRIFNSGRRRGRLIVSELIFDGLIIDIHCWWDKRGWLLWKLNLFSTNSSFLNVELWIWISFFQENEFEIFIFFHVRFKLMGCLNSKNRSKDSGPRSNNQTDNKSKQKTETYKLKILLLGDLGVGKTRYLSSNVGFEMINSFFLPE